MTTGPGGMTTGPGGPPDAPGGRPRPRHEPVLPNAWLIARREYGERVRSRPFVASTALLAVVALLVAFLPLIVRLADRSTTTTVAVVAEDGALADRARSIMSAVLNTSGGGTQFRLLAAGDPATIADDVGAGVYDAAIVIDREATGRLDFRFLTGERIGADRAQIVGIGTFAVAILEWTAQNPGAGGGAFEMPLFETLAAAGPTAGGKPLGIAEIASRQVLGTVFAVVIFLTIVVYGMWVAAGVVAEKSSRVMELLISAASARQLVVGKVAGIGLAGLTQYVAILLPALVGLALEDQIATFVLGAPASVATAAAALSPALLLAAGGFFVLGFTLYALLYAAAGSLVSRQEDLQVLALPMSLIGIVGYLQAVMSLSGGSSSVIRFSSYVPFWSPFLMLTRLTVGRVQPWEIVLSVGLLVAAIALVAVLAIRVYAAGVLLYGQRPGLRAIVRAVIRPTA